MPHIVSGVEAAKGKKERKKRRCNSNLQGFAQFCLALSSPSWVEPIVSVMSCLLKNMQQTDCETLTDFEQS